MDARSTPLSFHPFLKGVSHGEVSLFILNIQMVALDTMLLLTPPFEPEISIIFFGFIFSLVL